jgi:putative ABC transport system permease protein
MIKKVINTLRNFKRSPLLLFISIPGLMVALTAAVLFLVFIKHETSYDKCFPNKDRVVRLYNTWMEDNNIENSPISIREAYTEIPQQIPEIELSTQIYRGGLNNVSSGEKHFKSQEVLYADAEIFNVFGLRLLDGNKDDALKQANTAVLAQSLANKLFPQTNCIGKIIKIGDTDYSITGLIKDLPKTTHFSFDILASMESIHPETFGGMEFFTYYLLKDHYDFDEVNVKISSLSNRILSEHFSQFNVTFKSGIEKLLRLHLHSITDFDLSAKGNMTQAYILGFIVAFILLIAVVNYVNLFILYGEKRATEIGIRKSFGASISSLTRLFYFESSLLNIIAFILTILSIAVVFSFASLKLTNDISFLEINSPYSIAMIVGLFFFLILITGAYPAFYLSRLNAIEVIKGSSQSVQRKKWLSVASVLIQFSVSVFLITTLIIINSQLNYLKSIPLGFHSDHIVGVSGFDAQISNQAASIKEELQKLPFIKSVGASAHFMGGGCSGQLIYAYGQDEETAKSINEYRIREGFCKTMGLQLAGGRFFNGSSEDEKSIVLNQAAVKMLGIKNPVGKYMIMDVDPLQIVGVVNDFYYNQYAGEDIAPLVISYSNRVNVFYLKFMGRFNKDEQSQVAAIFSKFNPDYHFTSFSLADVYSKKFTNINMLMKLLFYGALLAIFLSFTGMFALSVFNVEKRTKEIGIRKVLGSTAWQVLLKLIKDTLKWVLISMPLPFLVVYIIMNEWLKTFANRIDLNILYFLAGGAIVIIIAVLAVSIKSIQIARSNPVDSLRYE